MDVVVTQRCTLVVESVAVICNGIQPSLCQVQACPMRSYAGLRYPLLMSNKEVSKNLMFGKLDNKLLHTSKIYNASSRLYERPAAGSVGIPSLEGLSDGSPRNISSQVNSFEKVIEILTTLFPVWVILGTYIGIWKPSVALLEKPLDGNLDHNPHNYFGTYIFLLFRSPLGISIMMENNFQQSV